jgi:hypothetical protein
LRSSVSRRAKPAIVVLFLSTAVWLSVGLVSVAHTLWFGLGEPEMAVRISLIEWGPWIVLSPLIILFTTIVPITGANWKWALPVHVGASLAVALAIVSMTAGMRTIGPRGKFISPLDTTGAPRMTRPMLEGPDGPTPLSRPRGVSKGTGMHPTMAPREGLPPPEPSPIANIVLINARLTVPIYWLLVVSVLAWRHHRIALEREGRAIRAEREAVRARLAALQSQLQPHFLFNSLNAIAAFITRRPSAAEDMVCALSNLLRSILRMSERPEIPFREELEFARSYLAVNQIRFEDTLRVSWQIEPATNEAMVPTLLLQPLIENALEHGLRGAAGEIAIRAEARGTRLVLSVTDRTDEQSPESSPEHDGTHVGLRNTRERLTTLFGADYRLELKELSDGARAEVEFALRTTAA